MIDRLRRRMADRDVRRALGRRTAGTLPVVPERRALLVVLPPDDQGLRTTWAFLDRLDLPDRALIPVQVADEIGYAPDRFAGAVRHIGPDERDWRRLPTASARESVWTQRPDVALNLAPPSDLGAAVLVGASPAAVRVGLHDAAREPFYDLMVSASTADAVLAVERLLREIDPPLVPFR